MSKLGFMPRMTILGYLLLGLFLFNAPTAQFPVHAGPLDDLKKMGNGLDKAKDYTEPAKDMTDALQPWTLGKEVHIGRFAAAKLIHDLGGLYDDPQWEKYVNLVGRGLAPCSKRVDIKYRFAILNTDAISTYSAPGGYILITKGMLKELASEDELAGLLANEIAHISMRDVENEVKRKKALDALLQGGLTYANNSGQITNDQKKMTEELNDKTYELMKSKCLIAKSEYQADRLATDNLEAIGYNPAGLLTALTHLQLLPGNAPEMEDMNSKCPRLSLRVKKLREYIDKQGYDQSRRTVTKRFIDFRKQHPLP